MQQRDYDTFVQMLNAIGDLYGKKISEWAISIWWGALQHYDLAAVRDALNRHVQNPDSGQFMPKPADVVKMVQGTTVDSALVAWAKVDRAARQVGPYRDVVFDDPIIHRVLHDMGGWSQLGNKSEDEWPFVGKEFQNRYRGFRGRSEVPEYPPVLIGISGAYNRQKGHFSEAPLLIGDPAMAQRVRDGGTDKALLHITDASHVSQKLKRIA